MRIAKMAESWEKEWDEFYAEGKYLMWYPSESVVRFIASRIPESERNLKRALDLGCGNGRHLVFLAKEGFKVSGVDISAKSLKIARDWLYREGYQGELKKAAVTAIPYPDSSFDIVICYGLLDHLLFKQAQKAIVEINRILKDGGWLFLSLRSTRDSDYGKGEEIEPNTYLLVGDVEGDLPQHFFDGHQIKGLLSTGFILDHLECEERLYGEELSYIYSRWTVFAKKR